MNSEVLKLHIRPPFEEDHKLSLRPKVSSQHIHPLGFKIPACEQRSHLIHPPGQKIESCVWVGYAAYLEENAGFPFVVVTTVLSPSGHLWQLRWEEAGPTAQNARNLDLRSWREKGGLERELACSGRTLIQPPDLNAKKGPCGYPRKEAGFTAKRSP